MILARQPVQGRRAGCQRYPKIHGAALLVLSSACREATALPESTPEAAHVCNALWVQQETFHLRS